MTATIVVANGILSAFQQMQAPIDVSDICKRMGMIITYGEKLKPWPDGWNLQLDRLTGNAEHRYTMATSLARVMAFREFEDICAFAEHLLIPLWMLRERGEVFPASVSEYFMVPEYAAKRQMERLR